MKQPFMAPNSLLAVDNIHGKLRSTGEGYLLFLRLIFSWFGVVMGCTIACILAILYLYTCMYTCNTLVYLQVSPAASDPTWI